VNVSRSTRAIFLAPASAFFAVFLLFPVIAALALAWTSWSGFNLDQIAWIGTANFSKLGDDEIFKSALWHTVVFVAVTTLLLNVVGLGVAMLIDTRVRGSEFLRVAMFLPLGLSPVITAVLWQYLLGPYGLVNQVLGSEVLGLTDKPIGFLGDPHLALATVIAAAIWQYGALNMLLFYAALQSIPSDRVEAARIDGARWWSRLRWIVIPYLRPTLAICVVLNLIGGWKVFDLVYVLTNGGPNHATEVLSTYLYRQAFQFNNVGYASVIAMVITLLAILSALTRGRIAGRQYA
jgi:raffinose/stachyose/melibiose transport system permease protein